MSSHAQPPEKETFEPSDQAAVKDLRAPVSSYRMVIIDSTILILLLGVANYLVGKSDPGWLQVNPSPWLILPLYLGARHGMVGGIAGSLAGVITVLGLMFQLSAIPPIDGLIAAPAFFCGMIATGLITGTAHKLVTGPVRRVQRYAAAASRDNLRLSEEAALLRENEAALQEALLLHGAEYTALTEELGQLFTTSETDFESGLLALFHQHLGVTASAVFRKEEEASTFQLVCSRGAGDLIDDSEVSLDPADSRTISAAILSGKIVTATQMLDDPEANRSETILAVIPWGKEVGETEYLCVIYRMIFDRIHWETLSRIEAVFDWAMARRSTQPHFGEQPSADFTRTILEPAQFRRRIEVAKVAAKSLNLASRLIVFSPSSEELNSSDQNHFIEELFESIRESDVLGGIMSLRGDYAIGLLTQLGTDRAAELYASRLRELTGVKGIEYQVFDLFDPALKASLSEAEERDAEVNPIARSAGSGKKELPAKSSNQPETEEVSV